MTGFQNTNNKTNTPKTGAAVVPYKAPTNYVFKPDECISDMRRVDDLVEMLTYRRPNGSLSEQEFIRKWIASTGAEPDKYGNYIRRIGDAKVLWSAHTDSVHRQPGFQRLSVSNNVVRLHKDNFMSNCLGADDATGCWILREMMAAEVPGLYIFHRGEESGGLGSSWLTKNTPDIVKGISVACAFDRKGYGDVITSQGGICASSEFGRSFAALLGHWWAPTTGVYTDTAEYTGLISECTNLSVGYFNQHTEGEWQDLMFAAWLRDKMVSTSASEIAAMATRNPAPRYSYSSYYGGKGSYSSYGVDGEDDEFDYFKNNGVGTNKDDGSFTGPNHRAVHDNLRSSLTNNTALISLIETYPRTVADFLEMNGFSEDDIQDHIKSIWGSKPSF